MADMLPNTEEWSGEAIARSEHIGPLTTGDNIQAKRVLSYGTGTDKNSLRNPLPLIDVPYDNFAMSNPDGNGNYQTIVFKNATTTVRTLALTYDANSKVTGLVRT